MFDEQLTENIKKKMKNISGIQSWYVDNLLIFKKNNQKA